MEWTQVETRSPVEGELVEVLLVSNQVIKPVEYFGGRFWKFRAGNGGHAYDVKAWRSIEKPKNKRENGRIERQD